MNKIPVELKKKIIEYLPLNTHYQLYKLFNIIIPHTLYMKILMNELNNRFCFNCGDRISLKYKKRNLVNECEQCLFKNGMIFIF